MVKKTLPDSIIKLTHAFRALLENDNIPVDSMIVFGSQAKGNARPGSDIDICVVSSSFGHDDMSEMQMLFKKARRIDSRIEPYPMSIENLKAVHNPIVNEITTWGVLV
jgi:predicted nucleotidyltransferase